MKCEKGYKEEQIIDIMIGKENGAQLKEHINECKACQQLYQSWVTVFSKQAETPNLSTTVKDRLNYTLHQHAEKSKVFNKPFYLILGFSIAILLVYLGFSPKPNDPKIVNLNPNQPFLVQEDTDIYEVIPDIEKNVSGYAWVNPNSHEMMLLVDGLKPISVSDYQAWIKTPKELKNAGIIRINGEKGQLYIKDGIINNIEHIVVSKEPRGGSQQMTDPNPYLIKLMSR